MNFLLPSWTRGKAHPILQHFEKFQTNSRKLNRKRFSELKDFTIMHFRMPVYDYGPRELQNNPVSISKMLSFNFIKIQLTCKGNMKKMCGSGGIMCWFYKYFIVPYKTGGKEYGTRIAQ